MTFISPPSYKVTQKSEAKSVLDEARRKEISKFLENTHCETTFFVIIYERTLLAARLQIIQESLLPLKTALLNPAQLGRNYKSDPNFRDWVRSIHAHQLNAIADIFMLFEDYFVCSNALRTDPSKLFEAIASDESFTREAKHLKSVTLANLRDYFHISASYSTASKEDSAFTNRLVNLQLKEMKRRIRRVIKFWNRYYTVYLAYKHKFSAFIGGYDVRGNSIISMIYVRHMRGKKVHTSVVPSELEAIDYYEDIVDDLASIFRSLIDNFVLYAINCGRAFFPELPILPLEVASKQEQAKLQEIIDRIPFYSTRIGYAANLQFSPRVWSRIASKMKRDFIYDSKQDIFSKATTDLR